MSSTYLSLHYHIVFSTKHRKPVINDTWQFRLHEYLGGTIRRLGGCPEQIGGVADHVHLLVGLRATHCLADVLRETKRASSIWVHETIGIREFAWQDGYAAITVSPNAGPGVCTYIRNQAEHHRTKSFLEELTEILNAAEVEYDPKYLE